MVEVTPYSPQEIARNRHADLLREATQERLAAVIREGDTEGAGTASSWVLRSAAVLKGLARRSAVRTA